MPATYPPEIFRLKEFSDNSEGTSSSCNPHLLQHKIRKDVNAFGPSNPSASHTTHVGASASEPHLSSAESNPSLMINYLPSKFSNGMVSESLHAGRYRDQSESISGLMPGISSGWDGFMESESRPVSEYGDDSDRDFREDSSIHPWLSNRPVDRYSKMRWNKFKWILFVANLLLTTYSFVGLIFCLLAWFNTFQRADVLRVGNRTELMVSTLACCLGVFTSLIGWGGILLNNRSFLAVYTFLLWLVFVFILVPAYITYKRRTFNLEGKINAQWSQTLGVTGRLRIQNELNCCGYFSPFVEATVSQACYARSILPGCKFAYMTFEKTALKRWYTIAFTLAPVHIAVMVAGLLCSNHVTNRFGKGRMPKPYRLSLTSMAMIMEGFANELAEQYGRTSAIVNSRSKSRLQEKASSMFDGVSFIGHASGRSSGSEASNLPPHKPMYF